MNTQPRHNDARSGSYLLVLLAVVWFASMPFRALMDPDEGRYAEIPREMLQSHDWLTPRLNDLKYFEKPPLQYWMTAAFYSAFGVHEWTARLWAILLAFGCLPLVYGFCRQLGYRASTSLIASALLAINPLFVIVGQINLLDQGFTFFVVLALFSFLLAQRQHVLQSTASLWILLAWSALALAILSKGIVVLVLFGLTFGTYSALTRDWSYLRHMRWPLGLVIFFAISLPWFLLVQQANPEFASFFFVHEHLARFSTRIHARYQPGWYFPAILLVALAPVFWSCRAMVSIYWRSRSKSTGFRTEFFLLTWCLVVLVFFSFSQSKLAPYILPMMAPLAVLFAPVIERDTQGLARATWTVASLLVILATGIIVYFRQNDGIMTVAMLAWCGMASITALASLAVARSRRALEQRYACLAITFVAGVQFLFMAYAQALSYDSPKTIAALAAASTDSQTTFFSVGHYSHSVGFYLRRPMEVFDYRGELDFGLTQRSGAIQNDLQAFQDRWARTKSGIAFIDPTSFGRLHVAGLPGSIVHRSSRVLVLDSSSAASSSEAIAIR